MQTVNDFAPKNKLIIFKTMNEIKTRTNLINYIIEAKNYKSYLEIGIETGVNFNSIKIEEKVGVDPNGSHKGVLKTTSDVFFEQNLQFFDIIFIDGLHEVEQTKRDINNSLHFLNKEGTIIIHDCNPTTKESQQVPQITGIWTGDVWKAFVYYRRFPNIKMFVIDIDWGCGIIKRGKQEILEIPTKQLTWENFNLNRNLWLNLKDVNYLKETFDNEK